jgi:hypothetical protein
MPKVYAIERADGDHGSVGELGQRVALRHPEAPALAGAHRRPGWR